MLHWSAAALTFGLIASTVVASDWPQWRGHSRNAVVDELGLLPDWQLPPPVIWRADNLGDGYSSVAVADGRVFTLGKVSDEVRCVGVDDTSGKVVWTTPIGSSKRHAMSTPTYSDGRVFALDPDGKLNCLVAATGDVVWSRNLAAEFAGQLMSSRGYGESPLVDGDQVVCTPGGLESFMVALHRETGGVIWKATIPRFGPKGSDGAAFSSIVVTEACGIRQYVQLTGRGLIGIDSHTGKFIWGYNDICGGGINIPTPVVREEFVFSANGYNAGSVLLKIEPDPDTGVKAREVYRLRGTDFQNHHGGVVLIGDHIYGGHGSNNGLPTCLSLSTGKIIWKRRGPGSGSAAIAATNERIVFRYQNGIVAWIAATPRGYSLHGTFEIPGTASDSWSHPAIANGRLYLREQSTLWVHDLLHPGTEKDMAVTPQVSTWSPELLALRGLGATLARLPEQAEEWKSLHDRQRIYRYAIDNDATPGLPVISLTDDHLTPAGEISPDVFAALDAISERFFLSVSGTELHDVGLQQVSSLNSLAGLNVELCPKLTEDGFKALANCHSLRVLIAMGTMIGPDALKSLAESPALLALDLEVCDHVTDSACEVLKTFRTLKAISLKKTAFEPQRLTSAGISQLTDLKSLEVLDLTANDVNDALLSELKSLINLRELTLNLVGITDAGMRHLAEMRELRRLRLMYAVGFSGPTLTDAAIPSLIQLPRLEVLDLTASSLTDEGLLQLAELKSLQRLEIAKTKITPEGFKHFQQRLPRACYAL